MKIFVICKYASYAPYGMETRHFYMSNRFVQLGHDVKIFLSDSNHQLASLPERYEDKYKGISVQWLRTFKYAKAYGFKRILSWFHFEYILRNKLKLETKNTVPDLVIVSSLSLLSIVNGIWLKKKFGCKLVFEIRDIWPLVLTRISNISSSNLMYKWLRRLEIRGYNKSDVVIGTMPNLVSHVHKTTSSAKVLWVPHLINDSVDYKDKSRYDTQLQNIKQTAKAIVGYAGSINRSGAIENLLKASEILMNSSVHIVIVGEGPIIEDMKRLYPHPNVHFFDKIPQDEVVAFLKLCDVLYDGYLKSSIYKYGNSRNKYVEYCLSARPIVLSYEGYPLFIEEQDCGVTVEPDSPVAIADGVLNIVQKSEVEKHRLGTNALNFASNNLSVNRHIDKLLSVLEDV